MEAHSQETLRRVQQNDAALTTLLLCIRHDGFVSPYNDSGGFHIDDNNLLSKLGLAIGENSHLVSLSVLVDNDESNRGLLDGLRRNTSISKLYINSYNSPIIGGGLIYQVLKVYQEKQTLSDLNINRACLQNGEEEIINEFIRNCLDLKCIRVNTCNMTDEQFSQMFDAMVPLSKLKTLCFNEHNNEGHRIGNAVCISIANLLANTKSLYHLSITNNRIDTEGARIIASSLWAPQLDSLYCRHPNFKSEGGGGVVRMSGRCLWEM